MFPLAWSKAVVVGTTAAALAAAGFSPSVADDTPHCSSTGPTLRYLVLFPQGTDGSQARAEIAGNCGSTTAYYPQIAVAVARATDPSIVHRIGVDRVYSAQSEALRGDAQPSPERAPLNADDTRVSTADRSAEQWDMRMISADAAHLVQPGSKNVLVGVLDSGIDPNQPDLAGALDERDSAGCLTGKPRTDRAAWAPTTSPHGTHIAGTIAAADDGKGITGVAPGVRVASVKVVDDDGFIYPEAALCGLMWAADNGMAVTNNSYYVDPWLFTCAHTEGQSVVYEALRRAAEYATGSGVLNVAAATNSGVDLTTVRTDSASPDNAAPAAREVRQLGGDCAVLPAGLPGTVSTSAVDRDGVKAGYSAYGLGGIDLTAPGGDRKHGGHGEANCVLSTVPGGYAYLCGTSMAAPHVTGVAALLAATHPDASPATLRKLLTETARPLPCPAFYAPSGTGLRDAVCGGDTEFNGFYGHGMVDAAAAVTNRSILGLRYG